MYIVYKKKNKNPQVAKHVPMHHGINTFHYLAPLNKGSYVVHSIHLSSVCQQPKSVTGADYQDTK